MIGVTGSTAGHFIDMGNGVAETVLFVTLVVVVPGFAIFPRKDSEGKRKGTMFIVPHTTYVSSGNIRKIHPLCQ